MRNPDRQTTFRFRQFEVSNSRAGMKVGTDAVLLAAWALTDAGAVHEPRTIVDAGTGTGVIALLMAQRFPGARITAAEISAEACTEAAANFAASPWNNRITLVPEDFSLYARSPEMPGRVDLLISNPPFFVNGAGAPDPDRSLSRMAGSLSPLSLVEQSAAMLSQHGRLCMISTAERAVADGIRFRAAMHRLTVERLTEVTTGEGKPPRRLLWQIRRQPELGERCDTLYDRLTIRTAAGNPTPEYRRLVEPYYLVVK